MPGATLIHVEGGRSQLHAGVALGPDQLVAGRDAEVRLSAATSGGSLALYRSVVDGEGPPRHTHTHEDETIYVLDGHVEAECGEELLRGGAGSTIFLPRGLVHTFRSLDGPATMLFIVTPGHLDEFFAAKEQLDADGGDPSQLARLAREYF